MFWRRTFFLGPIPIVPRSREGGREPRLSLLRQPANHIVRTCSPHLWRQSRPMFLHRLSSRLCRALSNCCRISLLRVALAAILLADGKPLPLLCVAVAVTCAAYCGGRRATARNVVNLEVLPAKAYLRIPARNSGRVSFQIVSEGAGVDNEGGNMQQSRDWRPQCVRTCADRMKFWKWCAKKEKKSDENGGPVRSSIEADPNAREEEHDTSEETVGCCGFGRRPKKETNQRC